jgi:hypothetical protein
MVLPLGWQQFLYTKKAYTTLTNALDAPASFCLVKTELHVLANVSGYN